MSPEDLAVAIARIDANTASTHELLKDHIRDDHEVHEDHEKRLRASERFRYGVYGAVSLVSIGGGTVMYLLQL